MNKAYYAHVKWSKVGHSIDTHNNWDDPILNKKTAQAICNRLMQEYGGNRECYIRGKCLEVWVTDGKGKRID